MRRVVITGLGPVTSLGIGIDEFWHGVISSANGIREIVGFDSATLPVSFGGQIVDFDPLLYIDSREAKRMDRFTHFALAGVALACKDANLDLEEGIEDPARAGVYLGTALGGQQTFEEQHQKFLEKGHSRVSPLLVPMLMPNAPVGQICQHHRFKGPNLTIATSCASSLHPIGLAADAIRSGKADVMISGGSEAILRPFVLASFYNMLALSRQRLGIHSSRPFDRLRDGFVMGEGGGILVLEEFSHAKKRGTRIYAEILGWGETNDAYHITHPDPDGYGAYLAMRLALENSHISSADISYIQAHGTSTPINDKVETLAIKQLLGSSVNGMSISSVKSQLGHTIGAAGALGTTTAVLALFHQVMPPTINYEVQDPECDLDYVPNEARDARLDVALVNAFGFGGHNVSLCLRRWPQ